MSLKKQTFSGVIWTFLDTFLITGISFVATLFIARILGPADYGLMGMIAVFFAIGNTLVDSGLSQSIIRTKEADNKDYSTVFYLNLAISIFVYVVLFIAAPYIAMFFEQHILIEIVRIYCLSFIITAFSAIQLAQLNRNMQFKRITYLNVPSTIVGVIVGLTLSINSFGVWSLVWMHLSNKITFSVLLWLFSTWKPTLYFSKERMKYHYGFGYKLMLSGILNSVFNNIYNILIGKFYSVQSLGYFDRAKKLNDYPVTILTGIISKVTYPLLSKIQDEKERISKVYKQLIQFSFFISTPLMFGLAAIAPPLFQLVLGDQWMDAVPYFQIICLASIFYPVHSFNLNILKVYGKSNLFLKLEVYKKLIIVLSIVISFPFGIIALVWSTLAVSFVSLLINTHYSQRLIDYKTARQLLDMVPILIIASIVSFTMYYSVFLFEDYSLYVQIIVPLLLGAPLYLIINFLFKTKSMQFGLELIKGLKK